MNIFFKTCWAYIFILTVPSSSRADRPVPGEKPNPGRWEIVRMDLGEGAAQARFVPDGKVTLVIGEDGTASLVAAGGSVRSGNVEWQRNGSFRLKLDGPHSGGEGTAGEISGTWGNGVRRLILSFDWSGIPVSVLLQSIGPPYISKDAAGG